MKLKKTAVVLSVCGLGILGLAGISAAAPPVIDDQKLAEILTEATGNAVGKEGIPTADALAKQAKDAKEGKMTRAGLVLPDTRAPKSANYESLSKSVYLLDSVYKCGKCSHWHQGSTATAWCLSGDGLMVTNAHVFLNAKGEAMGIVNRDGLAFQVTELLAIDVAADVALFRVNGKGMTPLSLGGCPDVGVPLQVISNPAGNLFIRTEGAVSRYSLKPGGPNQPKVPWMEITADYAVGSSGGPVFNHAGEVVGMVSSTRSIYTGGKGNAKGDGKGDLQMVIKNCVPVDSIRALFGKK